MAPERRDQPPGHVFSAAILCLVLSPLLFPQGKGPEIRKTDDGISYVSAGVGKESRENLPPFPLKLVFSTKTSRYLANIETEIVPARGGKPARIQSTGPCFLGDLPPAKNTARARPPKS